MSDDTSQTSNEKELREHAERIFAVWEMATTDAALYGIGVMIINSQMRVEYIPISKYQEMAEALNWRHSEHKKIGEKNGGKVH